MDQIALDYWESYAETLDNPPEHPKIEVGIAGNLHIADRVLELYLNGKKYAGSGLVKDFKLAGEPLPKVGNFWIILNSNSEPKCIVKTIDVKQFQFDQVPKEVALAEGEGDLSIEAWQKAYSDFFSPYLKEWDVEDLNKELIVTEFFELVYKS